MSARSEIRMDDKPGRTLFASDCFCSTRQIEKALDEATRSVGERVLAHLEEIGVPARVTLVIRQARRVTECPCGTCADGTLTSGWHVRVGARVEWDVPKDDDY